MDERSYLQVARVLNIYGLWTSWCSVFLTEAGFALIGMPHLERSLHSSGWEGHKLALHTDIDLGGGFGYGNILVDETALAQRGERWLRAAQNHAFELHGSHITGGRRMPCVLGSGKPRVVTP